METKKIREDFIFPLGLEQVDTVYGIPIYSSEKLKQKYVEIFSKGVGDNQIAKKVSNLVNDGSIVPCFVTKGMWKTIISKLRRNKPSNWTATYSFEKDKIYVAIEMLEYKMFNVLQTKLVKFTLHELIHMFASRNSSKFKTLFWSELKLYYSSFFECYFRSDFEDKLLSLYIRELIDSEQKRELKVHLPIKKTNENLDKVEKYNSFVEASARYNYNVIYSKKYEDIIDCLTSSYGIFLGEGEQKEISSVDQGVWVISEVISVLVEMLGLTVKIKQAVLLI